jgi:hypothetical protein
VKFLTTPLITLVILIATAARAQTQPTKPIEPPNPFAEGVWDMTLTGSYTEPIRFSEARTYSAVFGIGKYIWNNTAFNLELQGYWADQPSGEPDAIIGGFGVLGRTHLFRIDKFSFFIDGGGGITYASNAFPTTPVPGTHYNLTGKVGIGATWQLKEHAFLIGGVRYFHLSNAQVHGRDQNPTYDSAQFWAGFMWTW